MRMADGGTRPAYNLQVATDPVAQVVLDVDVSQSGSDEGQLKPAYKRLRKRYKKPIGEMLTDGGFSKKKDIEDLGEAGCTVYAPVPKHKAAGKKKRIRRDRLDGPHVAAWRKRMESDEAKNIYRIRAQTECVHAHWRNRGLYQMPVRGKAKVKAVALLHAVAHNILRMAKLMKKAS
jgi:hypothetical protein